MEFKGTKGEWLINRNNIPDLPEAEFEIEGDNMQVAISFDYDDAKLIASAPCLLKELQKIKLDIDLGTIRVSKTSPIYIGIEKAINKALK